MAHIASDALGAIIDNYADAIEGGNAYRGSGTAYKGIPGTYSDDSGLRLDGDGSVTASGSGSATIIEYASGDWAPERWVKQTTPGFWMLCLTGSAVGEARKITGWDNAAKEFTVDAFSVAPGDGATFRVLHGFKRAPNGVDLNDEQTEAPHGYDRFFTLDLMPVGDSGFWGTGVSTIEAQLTLTLRLTKSARSRDIRRSALENIQILSTGLQLGVHREVDYLRALLPQAQAPTTIIDDQTRLIMSQMFTCFYRASRGLA